jgi:uncharacterized protein YjbI with pentapeptide repeats
MEPKLVQVQNSSKATEPPEEDFTRPTQNFFLLCWIRDFKGELVSASGWKLFGAIIAGVGVFWGSLIALMTYQSSQLLYNIESADRAYGQLVSDLGQDSTRVRIAAIKRIPDLMLRQVPVTSSISTIGALKMIVGWKVPTTAKYHPELKRVVRFYVSSLNSNENWSRGEARAVLDILVQLGPEGWYEAKPRPAQREYKHSLSWIWIVPKGRQDSDLAVTLFQGSRLEGSNFQQFKLDQADFQNAQLSQSNFSYAHLKGANLSNAMLEQSDLSYSDCSNSQLEHTKLTKSRLASTQLDAANLKHALLNETQMSEATLERANLLGANLEKSVLRKANLKHANLQNVQLSAAFMEYADLQASDLKFSTLTKTTLTNSRLDFANLSFATLTYADLSFASFSQTDLSGADLTGANFTGAKYLDTVKSWLNANLADAKGLTKEQIEEFVSRGAVVIPNHVDWLAYKEAGHPHKRWQTFASGPPKKNGN